MGHIFSKVHGENAESIFLDCLRRNRRRKRKQDSNAEIAICVDHIHVYTGTEHLNLVDQCIGSNDALIDILQTHPEPRVVQKLTMTKMDAVTQIPSAIGHFDSLQVLILSDNRIEVISWALVYLKKLQILDVSFNMLKDIPRVIGYLSELEELYLQGNHISRLPTELLKLTKLTKLDVSKNYKLFPSAKVNVVSDKVLIFQMLEKRVKRQDIWEHCTPWVGGHNYLTQVTRCVLSLHELCVIHIIKYKLDFLSPRFIPPVIKNNLSELDDSYRHGLNMAKCSNCKSYFSTKEYFDNHLC